MQLPDEVSTQILGPDGFISRPEAARQTRATSRASIPHGDNRLKLKANAKAIGKVQARYQEMSASLRPLLHEISATKDRLKQLNATWETRKADMEAVYAEQVDLEKERTALFASNSPRSIPAGLRHVHEVMDTGGCPMYIIPGPPEAFRFPGNGPPRATYVFTELEVDGCRGLTLDKIRASDRNEEDPEVVRIRQAIHGMDHDAFTRSLLNLPLARVVADRQVVGVLKYLMLVAPFTPPDLLQEIVSGFASAGPGMSIKRAMALDLIAIGAKGRVEGFGGSARKGSRPRSQPSRGPGSKSGSAAPGTWLHHVMRVKADRGLHTLAEAMHAAKPLWKKHKAAVAAGAGAGAGAAGHRRK
jgi:hypothetical protein